MLSSASFPQEENNDIASPLLGRENQFNIADQNNESDPQRAGGFDGVGTNTTTTNGSAAGSMDPRLVLRHPVLRGLAMRCASMSCAADSLPTVFYYIVTEGKTTVMVMGGAYLLFVALWLPFWLLSFVVTEWGVYALAILTVFGIGRSVLRMIAFPGASCRVRREIEGEFAKYSVQMLVASVEALSEVASLLFQATASPEELANMNQRRGKLDDLPNIWRRAELYKDRVVAVYLQVLCSLYDQVNANGAPAAAGGNAYLTKYGNNRLIGDIGNVVDLTPEARADGREMMERLQALLDLIDNMAQEGSSLLQSSGSVSPTPNPTVADLAKRVMHMCGEMRDFCVRLKPSANGDRGIGNDDNDSDPTVAVRQQLGGGAMDAMKTGFSSILPMLDPSPHTSVFGLDVQRGCMISRYQGARQLWVRRPTGGLIDVLHFPAINQTGSPVQGNQKALLYCNPNAGLIEVAGGMSLVGGNVPSAEGSGQGETWIDFYTSIGFDVYLYNYAGYGRSYGTTYCSSTPPWSRPHSPGALARLYRIFVSCLCHFQPTPDTLRADGYAVAEHILNDAGVQELVIHGESIGGVAASGAARKLSHLPNVRNRLSLLICDRTFCNLEAVAQRLVGGWTGYAIRTLTLFAWSTDVAGDFLAANCPKVVANDAADAMISDEASLKSGIALWKEIHRGIATTKGIAWQREVPLQYRMAEFDNVCVNDSRYVAGNFLQAKAPTWPNDKHLTVEEVFHFAACCKRIGKLATLKMRGLAQSQGLEIDPQGVAQPTRPLIMEAWKYLSTCDGLTGATLGSAVKRGFDATVAWLCACLVFGGQPLVDAAEQRGGELAIVPSDFDTRPPGYTAEERDGVVFPKPIPEVVERLAYFASSQDEEIRSLAHEFQFVVGVLQYVQARLSAPPTVEVATQCRRLHVLDGGVGCFLKLHCGHNSAFEKDEKEKLQELIAAATASLPQQIV